jgi:hypothetical protein
MKQTRLRRTAMRAPDVVGWRPALLAAIALTCASVVWGVFARWSTTWLLWPSAIASVVTFLVLFSLQNTQNRDTRVVPGREHRDRSSSPQVRPRLSSMARCIVSITSRSWSRPRDEHAYEVSGVGDRRAEALADRFAGGAVAEVVVAARPRRLQHDLHLARAAREFQHRLTDGIEAAEVERFAVDAAGVEALERASRIGESREFNWTPSGQADRRGSLTTAPGAVSAVRLPRRALR